jgi:type I restriction enzyme S subunit
MSEWIETSLENLCLDVSYGYTASANFENGHSKFLRITDIQNGTVNWEKVPYCSINHQNYQKYKLLDGDIVIARTGNSTGENYLFCGGENAVFASYLVRFRIDKNLANSRFVWYTLRTPNWWQFINNSKTGSAQAGANAKVLGSFPILLPPLSEQKAIAHILGSLDDKIELNRRMNETLEAMARAIFKDWFVDFGPTRAKIEGRAPYLPEPIWSLFPDAIDPLSGLPIGWELGRFEELASAKQGRYLSKDKISTISTSEYPYPVLGGNGILGFSKTYIYKEKMILITCRGSNCGLIRKTSSESWISNNSFAVKPRLGSYFFLYIYFLFEDFRDCISGSAQPQITYTALKSKIMAYPFPKELVDLYSNLLEPTSQKMEKNDDESRTLAELRDRLLPKLMSGQIRVKDAEKIVEEVL